MRYRQLHTHPSTILGLLLLLLFDFLPKHCGPRAPELLASTPPDGAEGVLRTEWIELAFARRVPPFTRFVLHCGDEPEPHPVAVHRLERERLVVNPEGELPAGTSCMLGWRSHEGPTGISFTTAAAS